MTRRRRRALRVVNPPKPRRRLPFLIACFVVVGTMVLGVVSVQAVASQGSFRMQELSRRNAELQDANGRLQLQIAEMSAPGRIEREARKLGFRVPDLNEVHTIVAGRKP